MQNGRHNFNNAMSFHPPHHQIDRFPSQNPPIYCSYGFQPRHSSQFHHQPPNPPVNPPPPPLPVPHGYGGCSDYEQRLRDEVIYLHSLWHRGPPRIQEHINNTQCGFRFTEVRENSGVGGLIPLSIPLQIRNPHLKPLPRTPLKKKKKNRKKKPSKPQIVSDKEWPVDTKTTCPSPPGHGWGEFKSQTLAQTRPAPPEEQERVLAVRVHLKALDSCIGFFKKSSGDEEEDDDDDEEEYDEEEVFEFFIVMFGEDEKLREYYKTKCENGEFYCLVCGVTANKLGRKYKDCVALVQHSVTISKTKKKIAHRAYGRVVCQVLGWDIDRLPSLPSTLLGANAVVQTPHHQNNLPSQ